MRARSPHPTYLFKRLFYRARGFCACDFFSTHWGLQRPTRACSLLPLKEPSWLCGGGGGFWAAKEQRVQQASSTSGTGVAEIDIVPGNRHMGRERCDGIDERAAVLLYARRDEALDGCEQSESCSCCFNQASASCHYSIMCCAPRRHAYLSPWPPLNARS